MAVLEYSVGVHLVYPGRIHFIAAFLFPSHGPIVPGVGLDPQPLGWRDSIQSPFELAPQRKLLTLQGFGKELSLQG